MPRRRLTVGDISHLLESAKRVADMMGIDRLGGGMTCEDLKARMQSIAGVEPDDQDGYSDTRLSRLLVSLSKLRTDARVLEAAEIQAQEE